jgi:hypothetical protein
MSNDVQLRLHGTSAKPALLFGPGEWVLGGR